MLVLNRPSPLAQVCEVKVALLDSESFEDPKASNLTWLDF
jgi:hypothetical protein